MHFRKLSFDLPSHYFFLLSFLSALPLSYTHFTESLHFTITMRFQKGHLIEFRVNFGEDWELGTYQGPSFTKFRMVRVIHLFTCALLYYFSYAKGTKKGEIYVFKLLLFKDIFYSPSPGKP